MARDEYFESDVAVGAMSYSRSLAGGHAQTELRKLTELLNRARLGIVVDCSAVELGTSEVINVFLQISKLAKDKAKHVALFNVPESLQKSIKITGLKSVIMICADAVAAKQRIYKKCGVEYDGNSAPSSKALAAAIAFAAIALAIFGIAFVYALR